MVIDKLSSFDENATVTGGTTTASVDTIDLGVAGRRIGSGQPLFAVFHIKSRSGGDASDTFTFGVQTSNSSTFASGNVTVARSAEYTGVANVPVRIVVGIPHGVDFLRYVRATYAVTADAVLVVDAYLTDQEPYDHKAYPDGT